MRAEDLKINNIFWEKYKFFYIFNSLIKFFCFFYFIYFFTFFLDFGFLSSLFNNFFQSNIDEFAKTLQPVYIVLLLFVNTTLMDFLIDLCIMLTEQDQLILSGVQLVQRGNKAVATTIIGGGVVGSAISVSLKIELSGINESQVYLGRGYGYKTSIDWGKGIIINSYIEKEKMQNLARKYGNKNILNGNNFSQILKNEKAVAEHLNKNATP